LVNQIPDQPIIVAKLTGDFTVGDTAAFCAEIAGVAAEFEGKYYRILDMSDITVSTMDILQALGSAAKGTPGTATDPRVRKNFYVGLEDGWKTLRLFLEQNPTLVFEMIISDTLEQTLNHIYTELEDKRDQSSEEDL
jgi:hypothetical protein